MIVECKITGEFLWRDVRGFGPFKKEHWESEHFSCIVRVGEPRVSPVEGLTLGCVRAPNGFVVAGNLEGIECTFGEFTYGDSRTESSFNMLTVRDVQVRGNVEVVGGPVALSMARGFAA